MAKPITTTELEESDFDALLRDLESPKINPKATEMYIAGRIVHERMHRKK